MPKNHITISPDVIESVARCTFDGNTLKLPDPRIVMFSNWPAMKKVFDALGGKWEKKAKAVVFPSDAKALLLPAVEAGSVLNKKKHFQYFATPEVIARKMVNIAVTSTGDETKPYRVLEPSAGEGALVKMIQNILSHASVQCVEIQTEFYEPLRELSGRPPVIRDFLKVPKSPIYDLVIMNPPFQDNQDIRHVRHAFGFLKPGGRLVSVMCGGVESNEDNETREFRAWKEAKGGQFFPVQEGAFKESGTSVRTCIFVADR